MFAKQIVIPRIRRKPERENGTNDRHDADDFIDENIERHSAKENFRDIATDPVNQDRHRNQRGSDVTETRDKIEKWVQTETALYAWNPDQSIHDQRDPFKDWLG